MLISTVQIFINILNIIIIKTKTLWVLISTSVTDQVNKVLLSQHIAFCRFYVSQFLTKIFCVETKSLIYFKSEIDKIIRIRLIISLTRCLWTLITVLKFGTKKKPMLWIRTDLFIIQIQLQLLLSSKSRSRKMFRIRTNYFKHFRKF